MWGSIAKLIAGLVEAYNRWAGDKRDAGLLDTGRQLQTTDGLKAAVQGDVDALKTSEAVAALSDDALAAELRDGPPAGADRK